MHISMSMSSVQDNFRRTHNAQKHQQSADIHKDIHNKFSV